MNTLDFYPFNLPVGGPFLVFFVCAACIIVIAALAGRRLLAKQVIDRATPPAPRHTLLALAIGAIPHGDHVIPLAYLRRGIPGLTNLLITMAVGARLLVPEHPSMMRIDHTRRPASRFLEKLMDELAAATPGPNVTIETVQRCAENSAAAHEREIQRALIAAGLTRSLVRVAVHVLIVLLPILALALVGFIRCALLASINRPFGNLFMAIFALLLAGAVLSFIGRYKSRLAVDYLRWLESATRTLIADVATGVRNRTEEVSLALAIAGTSITHGPLSPLAPLLVPDTPIEPHMINEGSLMVGTLAWWTARNTSGYSGGSSCGGGGCGGGGGGGCS